MRPLHVRLTGFGSVVERTAHGHPQRLDLGGALGRRHGSVDVVDGGGRGAGGRAEARVDRRAA